jgi:hypothetical protein
MASARASQELEIWGVIPWKANFDTSVLRFSYVIVGSNTLLIFTLCADLKPRFGDAETNQDISYSTGSPFGKHLIVQPRA